ncbi:Ni,Fe-hydrogenase I cytochrome b subunit [hydrothermal vent metagenome]|uniref:Ni,Fe-hydrogenase I cytochrome b subunit n=1 Tax=hydrothermal vent metagenome TaxID=652676 RepID=A0A3B0VLE1_9ZZZZ
MVFALLGALAFTTISGLQAYAVEGKGPLASIEFQVVSTAMADDDHRDKGGKHEEDEDEFWEEVHEFFSTLTLLLVLLHISGVVISSKLHKENLAKAMVSGQKQVPPE